MKHILLLSIILFFSAGAMAQPVIIAATNNPVAGDAFAGHYCDTTGYSTLVAGGDSGADVVWNFDSLVLHSEDTFTFINSLDAPDIDSFPGTNLVSFYPGSDTTYTYYIANSNYLAVTGSCTPNFPGGILPIIKPDIVMNYPMIYGTRTADTSIQLDGGTYYIGADSNFTDGYGTLILPSGIYTNVLRVHVKVVQIDSTPGVTGNYSFGYNEYYWYKPWFHNCLLSLMYGGFGGGNYLAANTYYYTQAGSPAAIATVNKNTTALVVSPNPAVDIVHLKFTITDPANTSITLTDVSGRIVGAVSSAQISAGLNDIAYPVSGLAAGVYFVRLSSDGGSEVKKVVVVR